MENLRKRLSIIGADALNVSHSTTTSGSATSTTPAAVSKADSDSSSSPKLLSRRLSSNLSAIKPPSDGQLRLRIHSTIESGIRTEPAIEMTKTVVASSELTVHQLIHDVVLPKLKAVGVDRTLLYTFDSQGSQRTELAHDRRLNEYPDLVANNAELFLQLKRSHSLFSRKERVLDRPKTLGRDETAERVFDRLVAEYRALQQRDTAAAAAAAADGDDGNIEATDQSSSNNNNNNKGSLILVMLSLLHQEELIAVLPADVGELNSLQLAAKARFQSVTETCANFSAATKQQFVEQAMYKFELGLLERVIDSVATKQTKLQTAAAASAASDDADNDAAAAAALATAANSSSMLSVSGTGRSLSPLSLSSSASLPGGPADGSRTPAQQMETLMQEGSPFVRATAGPDELDDEDGSLFDRYRPEFINLEQFYQTVNENDPSFDVLNIDDKM